MIIHSASERSQMREPMSIRANWKAQSSYQSPLTRQRDGKIATSSPCKPSIASQSTRTQAWRLPCMTLEKARTESRSRRNNSLTFCNLHRLVKSLNSWLSSWNNCKMSKTKSRRQEKDWSFDVQNLTTMKHWSCLSRLKRKTRTCTSSTLRKLLRK